MPENAVPKKKTSFSLKNMGQGTKILLFMIIGCLLGYVFRPYFNIWGQVTTPIGDVFIRLLKMVVIPLIFFSIAGGISSIADMSRLKKVGKTFSIYWILSSALAACIGLTWAYIINPGLGVHLTDQAYTAPENIGFVQTFVNWVPSNPVDAMANFKVIQVIVFAVFFGIGMAMLANTEPGKALIKVFDGANQAIGKIIEMVMKVAWIGVFCLMANVTGNLGADVITGLAKMLMTQYLAYATILFVLYPLILKLIAKVSPIQHFKNVYPAMVLAFSTCSSNATLPLTMRVTEERAGVPHDMVGLIALPAITINMHACAAEMPIYAVFAAQLFGVHYSFPTMLLLIVLAIAMAAGVSGIPGSSIALTAILMQAMALPLTIVPWVAGIYRLIDMPNTMTNTTGNTVGMVTTAAVLKELDRELFNEKKGAA